MTYYYKGGEDVRVGDVGGMVDREAGARVLRKAKS